MLAEHVEEQSVLVELVERQPSCPLVYELI
jgi:hypothetical protein